MKDAPYSSGDCGTFMDVPPIVFLEDGTRCVNPDFESVRQFRLRATGRDPAFPDVPNSPQVTLGPGESAELVLTNDREEGGLGHMIIDELLLDTEPQSAALIAVTPKLLQGDRDMSNDQVLHTLMFGDSFLNCCLICPFMLLPNQSVSFKVLNLEAVDVQVRITARGRRLLPYHDPALASEAARCWAELQSYPYWLTIDGREVEVPAAAGGIPGQVTVQMSVPGGGWFELGHPRCQVEGVGGPVGPDDLEVEVTEGRIGKKFMTGPVRLGSQWATPTLTGIVGFPGDMYRAAAACASCPPSKHLVRGNTRLGHTFYNHAAFPARVILTYAGCFHELDRCPPGKDLEAVRRYGGNNAAALAEAGNRDFLLEAFVHQNPLYVDQAALCAPPRRIAAPAPRAAAPTPEPLRLVSTWRPNKKYFGPGSTGALPGDYHFAADQHGRTHLVQISGGQARIADPGEVPWTVGYLAEKNRQAGLAGMAQGEWERI